MKSLLWPWYKYKQFWQKIDCMSPKQKAMMPMKAARTLLDFISVHFLSDLRVFWFSYMAGLMVLIYMMLATYTIIYYTYHNQVSTGLKATCVIGVALPVTTIFLIL